eukprot:11188708-Lingulodinium_polyedra.AAC.1
MGRGRVAAEVPLARLRNVCAAASRLWPRGRQLGCPMCISTPVPLVSYWRSIAIAGPPPPISGEPFS